MSYAWVSAALCLILCVCSVRVFAWGHSWSQLTWRENRCNLLGMQVKRWNRKQVAEVAASSKGWAELEQTERKRKEKLDFGENVRTLLDPAKDPTLPSSCSPVNQMPDATSKDRSTYSFHIWFPANGIQLYTASDGGGVTELLWLMATDNLNSGILSTALV